MPIEIVWRVLEHEGTWYVMAQGVPGGDYVLGPYPDEKEARADQLACAKALAKKLGIDVQIGNPSRAGR